LVSTYRTAQYKKSERSCVVPASRLGSLMINRISMFFFSPTKRGREDRRFLHVGRRCSAGSGTAVQAAHIAAELSPELKCPTVEGF
jgi:hypothetical protein